MLKGVDVSWHQLPLDWVKLRAGGYAFAIVRASCGLVPDGRLTKHLWGARGAGLAVGTYHYLTAKDDPVAQAVVFVGVQPRSFTPAIAPMVDVEDQGLTEAAVRVFIEETEARLGVLLRVYTSKSKWERICGRQATWVLPRQLHVAHYGVKLPLLPVPWTAWQFWQYGIQASPGYPKPVDHDLYDGTLADFAEKPPTP